MRVRALIAAATAASALLACNSQETLLRAYQATSPHELIGGDVAMARVGDFILENDRIRIAILGVEASAGPGVFGGTLVDADIQRAHDSRFSAGNGDDQLAELFPFANLLAPRPEAMDVTIVDDGSSGERAVIRVSAEGEYFLSALSVLDQLTAFFPDAAFSLNLQTDYILEPGKNYVKMVTTATRTDPYPYAEQTFHNNNCPSFDCDLACPNGFKFDYDGEKLGCQVCECAHDGVLPMVNFLDTAAIFGTTLGDFTRVGDPDAPGAKPGIVGGDFVFFGGQNDLFAPGMGFDEDTQVFDALFQDRDTFTEPFPFDYMVAAGGDVSYGYFSANAPGEPDPKVLVPIITSSTTAFVTAGRACDSGAEDDDTCDKFVRFSWERYLVVGHGDVASVSDVIYEVRGTPVGRISGAVLQSAITPARNGKVFVLRDPDPTRTWSSIHEVVEANRKLDGTPGVLNAIDADVGRDRLEDGAFGASLPPGTYLFVATNESQTLTSAVDRLTIEVGKTTNYVPVLPAPGSVRYRVTDNAGALTPAKLSFVNVLEDGSLAERDGLRKPYLGEGRYGNGVRHRVRTLSGEGVAEIEPGTYEVVVSRGPEYSIDRVRVTVGGGSEAVIAAQIRREVDTSSWIAADTHLHAEPSFDSGMKLERRVTHAVVEGVELAVATDHDIVTDYSPAVIALDVQDLIKTAVGVEVSTLELGHITAFPLKYDGLDIPDHSAPDWHCRMGGEINAEVDTHFDGDGVRIMAHPRDGFIGYISQLGVHPYETGRSLSLFESGNVLFREATCDFHAMEVFNSKRFDLIRTPTNREVILYNRCYDALGAATSVAELDVACPYLNDGSPLATCAEGTRHFECQMRHRRVLAYQMMAEMLTRTPEEQKQLWERAVFAKGDSSEERACDPTRHNKELEGDADNVPDDIADRPCIEHPGTADDHMRWLDYGMMIPVTAASDSHGELREPGTPRTLVKSEAQDPRGISPSGIARNIRQGKALATFGPVIDATIGGVGSGDIASVAPGQPFTLDLRVQTASWYGVDRIEIYVSGLLQKVIALDHGPTPIVDFEGPVTLTAPKADCGSCCAASAVPGCWDLDVMKCVCELDGFASCCTDTWDAKCVAAVEDERCGNCPKCGDKTCDVGETTASCGEDCTNECGDGSCGDKETCKTCPADCGNCCGNEECDADETPETCDFDCKMCPGQGDGFVTVIAVGTRRENLLDPVALDIPFGELQIPRVAQLAFSAIPGIADLVPKAIPIPDFGPTFPIAMTNPILLDLDGDGDWSRPGQPQFCPRACTPIADDAEQKKDEDRQCPLGQKCLDSGMCGLDVPGQCTTGPPKSEQAIMGAME